MAVSIKFQKDTNTDYTYSDLSLDLEREYVPMGNGFLYRESGNSDIKTDFDEHAIANSLRNLFSTRPKQRILNPEYGLDLHQFLFENCNEYSAKLIGRKLDQGIKKYEPRVKVNLIEVIVDAENNKYSISINLFIPSIKRNVAYQGIFNENGFS